MDLLGRSDVLGAGSDSLSARPGLGANWFRTGGSPNDSLANLSFSDQRLQNELSQIVPRAIIIVIGLVFYILGGKTQISYEAACQALQVLRLVRALV